MRRFLGSRFELDHDGRSTRLDILCVGPSSRFSSFPIQPLSTSCQRHRSLLRNNHPKEQVPKQPMLVARVGRTNLPLRSLPIIVISVVCIYMSEKRYYSIRVVMNFA